MIIDFTEYKNTKKSENILTESEILEIKYEEDILKKAILRKKMKKMQAKII